MQSAIVTAEIAAALILTTGAGLMAHSFLRLASVDTGFRPERLLTWWVNFSPARYSAGDGVREYQQEVLRRVRMLPGVESVAVSNRFPLGNGIFDARVHIDGLDSARGGAMIWTVSPEYLATMRIALVRGRWLTASDGARAPLVAVISDKFAMANFGNENPLGRHIRIPHISEDSREIVGVTESTQFQELNRTDWAEVYLPVAQVPPKAIGNTCVFVLRANRDPLVVIPAVRSIAAGIDRDQPVFDIRTAEHVIGESVHTPRFRTVVFACFAALALLLAAIGVYGVAYYSVLQKTREFSIRIAVGATHGDIVAHVLRRSFWPVVCGLAIGVAGALAVSQALTTMLFEVKPQDPVTLAVVCTIVAATALVAGLLPARRATRIDPTVALRCE